MKQLIDLIESLTQEAINIQIQGRALTSAEIARVKAIYQALPLLRQALDLLSVDTAGGLITYKISSDLEGRLKKGARVACNFWNRYITPSNPTVIRLGVFTEQSYVIARAYEPYKRGNVVYGRVEFNTVYLADYSGNEIAGTIIHEIGHTLGFGWDTWMNLFDVNTGKFTNDAINKLPALGEMRVETDYGPGTQYAHWDEAQFDKEIMTGIKDANETVRPVTIEIMELLGHQMKEKLDGETRLDELLTSLSQVVFTRHAEAKALDLDYFKETEPREIVPHNKPLSN